jgi:Mrr N-terminal domain
MSNRHTYCKWTENALAVLGRATPKQAYRWIRTHEAVPSADLIALTAGGENYFEKNVRWARFTLFKAGVVSNREGRGVWTLA